jgi:hypothetical protein
MTHPEPFPVLTPQSSSQEVLNYCRKKKSRGYYKRLVLLGAWDGKTLQRARETQIGKSR